MKHRQRKYNSRQPLVIFLTYACMHIIIIIDSFLDPKTDW